MTTLLRAPLVGYGFLVDRSRRLPIAGFVLRHAAGVAGILIAGAVLAFAVWAGTVVPLRVALADLVAGNLPIMQSWVIVSGDLNDGRPTSSGYRYVFTDPAVPNAVMNVFSDVELPLGRTTISGTYTGPRDPVPAGYRWIGTLHADTVTAAELGPPLLSLLLLTIAALLIVAGRISYPMFFRQSSPAATSGTTAMPVRIRRGPLTTAAPAVPGSLTLEPGEPVRLSVSGAGPEPLRLESVYTGVDVGELSRIASSEPAMRIRRPTDELTLTFASTDERDAAYGALLADVERWARSRAARPTRSAQGELL